MGFLDQIADQARSPAELDHLEILFDKGIRTPCVSLAIPAEMKKRLEVQMNQLTNGQNLDKLRIAMEG